MPSIGDGYELFDRFTAANSLRMVESMTALSLVQDLLEVRRLLKHKTLGNQFLLYVHSSGHK